MEIELKTRNFRFKQLPGRFSRIEANIQHEFNDLQGEGMKITFPSNNIDLWTRLEGLIGINLSGHTDNLTERSNLIDEVYNGAEIQNVQQYGNNLDKFLSIKRNIKVSF